MARRQKRTLWVVLALNASMFVVELGAGLFSRSLSLTGDSLDMLGDAVAYGASLYAVGRSMQAKSRSALLKGGLMVAMAAVVLTRAVDQFANPSTPDLGIMVPTGVLALAVNLICLWVLTRHRHDDVNMKSVWLCSRNDIIANTSVLGAAWLVSLSGSPWPDLVCGLGITLLFLKSAMTVVQDARGGLSGALRRSV